MYTWYRRLGFLACGLVIVLMLGGCHKREHRTVRVHEEQREGEVHETRPGEMVPE
jgi:hypothetical protein